MYDYFGTRFSQDVWICRIKLVLSGSLVVFLKTTFDKNIALHIFGKHYDHTLRNCIDPSCSPILLLYIFKPESTAAGYPWVAAGGDGVGVQSVSF